MKFSVFCAFGWRLGRPEYERTSSKAAAPAHGDDVWCSCHREISKDWNLAELWRSRSSCLRVRLGRQNTQPIHNLPHQKMCKHRANISKMQYIMQTCSQDSRNKPKVKRAEFSCFFPADVVVQSRTSVEMVGFTNLEDSWIVPNTTKSLVILDPWIPKPTSWLKGVGFFRATFDGFKQLGATIGAWKLVFLMTFFGWKKNLASFGWIGF